jgi:hypothetical protein
VSTSGSALTLSAGGNIAINAGISGGTTGNFTATANGSLDDRRVRSVVGNTVALAPPAHSSTTEAVTRSAPPIGGWSIEFADAPGENFGNLNK